MGNKNISPFFEESFPHLGKIDQQWTNGSVKGGEICCFPPKILCVLDVNFKVDYDLSIKHDLILWSDRLMGVQSWKNLFFANFGQFLQKTLKETALYLSLTEEFSKSPTYYCSSASGLGDDCVSSCLRSKTAMSDFFVKNVQSWAKTDFFHKKNQSFAILSLRHDETHSSSRPIAEQQ